jgi:diguanylate cyclase (GGDEF)-like protein
LRKSNIFLITVFLVISTLALFLAQHYKESKVKEYQGKYLDTIAYSLNNEVHTLIEEKKNATLALALAFSQNNDLILSLYNDPNRKQKLVELSNRLRDNSDFKNVWIQLLDANSGVVVRSWSDIENTNLSLIRSDIKKAMLKKEVLSTISVGQFDMSFKATIPIFDKENRFIGALEVISHFNSIAKKIQDKGYEPVILVDKKYTKQLTHPFTQKFCGDYYVANMNAEDTLLKYINTNGLENFLTKEKIYRFDKNNKYLVINHVLLDVDDRPIANFLMFKNSKDLSYTLVENMKTIVNFVLFIVILIFGFLLYLVAEKEKKSYEKINALHLFLFFILYLFVVMIHTIYITMDFNKKESEYIELHNEKIQERYNLALNRFDSLAEMMFELRINKPEVLSLMQDAYIPKLKDAARQKLYGLLKDDYEYMKASELRQLHFHLNTNESFLRFHRPLRYGDNLTDIRKTVAYVNENHVKVQGFEEGRIFNGFRHVFPLFVPGKDIEKEDLGSVEISFNAYAIAKEFLKHPRTKIGFMLSKDIVNSLLFKNEIGNYEESELAHYYYDILTKQKLEHRFGNVDFTSLHASDFATIEANILKEKTFSLTSKDTSIIYTVIPIKNAITNKVNAILVVQEYDTMFINLKNNYYILLILGLIVITLLFLYAYREYVAKNQLQFVLQKMYNIFDLQREIVVITNAIEIKDANKQLLRFFGFKDLQEFKEHNRCICDRFEVDEKVFHLQKVAPFKNWVEALEEMPQKERIVMMQDSLGKKYIFSVLVNYFHEDYIISFSDVTDTIFENFSLMEKVHRDMLTGAYNREYFDENIELHIQEAQRKERFLGVSIFDIDFFKLVNDTCGHSCGDDVLVVLTNIVKNSIRKEDVLIRWGGEEFILLISVESLVVFEKVVDNIRHRIGEHTFPTAGKITCSFGATLYEQGEAIEETIKRADKALYKAKAEGRNRVCAF